MNNSYDKSFRKNATICLVVLFFVAVGCTTAHSIYKSLMPHGGIELTNLLVYLVLYIPVLTLFAIPLLLIISRAGKVMWLINGGVMLAFCATIGYVYLGSYTSSFPRILGLSFLVPLALAILIVDGIYAIRARKRSAQAQSIAE